MVKHVGPLLLALGLCIVPHAAAQGARGYGVQRSDATSPARAPGAPAAAYMGTYAPIVVVCSRAQFQLNYCASPSHATSGSRQDRLRIDGVMRKPIGPLWPRRATDTRHVATHMGGVPRLR